MWEKKQSKQNKTEGDIQGWSRAREEWKMLNSPEILQRWYQDDLVSSVEKKSKILTQGKSTYFYQNKAFKPVIVVHIRVKRNREQSGGKHKRSKKMASWYAVLALWTTGL